MKIALPGFRNKWNGGKWVELKIGVYILGRSYMTQRFPVSEAVLVRSIGSIATVFKAASFWKLHMLLSWTQLWQNSDDLAIQVK